MPRERTRVARWPPSMSAEFIRRRHQRRLPPVRSDAAVQLIAAQRPWVILSITSGVLKMMPSSVRRNVSNRSSDAVYARS